MWYNIRMKTRASIVILLSAALFSVAASGKVWHCEKGQESEHSHFSSEDVPSANGVRVKQKGPVGYACTTNVHPLVVWSRPFDGGEVRFAIDIQPIEQEKADLYVKWIKAGRIKGDSAEMPIGGGWKEKANAVMSIGNVTAVAADLSSEEERAWRHLSAIPAKGGMVVLVDFRVQAESAEAAEKHADEGCNEINRALSDFELLDPLVEKVQKSTATAWFVTPTNVVTCAHCIRGSKRFWFVDENGKNIYLKPVGADERHDVALLKVADPEWRSSGVLSVSSRVPRRAEKVWTLGYPLPQMLGETVKYGEGVVSSHEGFNGDEDNFSVTAPIRPGLSGGPVLDEAGKVCGIMDATLKAQMVLRKNGHVSPESNFAVKVEHVRALLEKHGVPCEGADPGIQAGSRADAVEAAARAVVLFFASEK